MAQIQGEGKQTLPLDKEECQRTNGQVSKPPG